jgi:hypothetical protein
MTTFKDFLFEDASEEKLKHLEHAEDHVLHGGSAGFSHAYHNLKDVHDKLTGKDNDTKVTMKYDGSPSVVFGRNPENGKFFVATKSAFNKNPKINYTHEDIQKNHGHAPGLVEKLKQALDHLPKVTPKKGVFQGDIMHSKGDVQVHGQKVKFTPNTITYGADKNSEHGQAALKSQIGVAVHTAYKGKDLDSMKAEYAPALNKFGKHPDVHVISTEHKLDGAHYKPEHQQQFAKHMKAAAVLHKSMPEEGYDAVVSHNIPLKTYINHTVRHGTTPTLAGFKKHFEASHQKKIDSVKTDKAKASKTEAANADMAHVSTNRAHFQRALDMHKHLQKAKDILTHTMSKSSEFEHSINGKKAKPEGFVAVRYNRPTKFVDRSEFSAANFNKDKNL